ncbi:MAG: hypothetical protein AAFR14_01510 [Bacteroidota bacterium]
MSQSRGAFVEAAQDAYDEEDYYSSLRFYLEALDFDSTDVEVKYMIAESARNFLSYEVAEEYYTQVLSEDAENTYPKASYFLAEMQQMQGKYDMAKRNYEMYLSLSEGDDSFVTSKAQMEIANIDWAKDMTQNPEPSVSVSLLPGDANTPYSEISATQVGDQVVYSSVQFLPEDRKTYGNKFISKVLSTDSVGDGPLLSDNNLHTANLAYNTNRTKVFYTVCHYINGSDIRCDLYSRQIMADGSFGEGVKLPEHINADSITTTQPVVGFDQESGQELLYFVSDREGGKGKLDIWYSSIDGEDEYSQPINLTSLNTIYNEITPFFHNNTQVLYFSSDGYKTLGGYDIYRSLKEGDDFSQPENLRAPTNGSFNDAFYSIDENGEQALFSSNRLGSQYIDELNKSCCYDIYEATISDLEINLNALTFDAKSLDSLEGATVQLVCVSTGDIMGELTNDIAADHIFQLERNKEYMIITSKPGYATDTMMLNTKTVFKSEDIVKKIYLERTSLDLEVFTFDEISGRPLPGTTVRLINLTDETIQEVVLTNEAANDFLFEVKPGHSYRLEASRDRYYSDSIEFVAKDDLGTGTITKELFLVRRDLNIYLPLELYFDNDHPDLRSTSLQTQKTYSETFGEYVIKKEEFKRRYASGAPADNKELAQTRVDEFFEEEVKDGYDVFLRFLDYITGQLQDGYSFDLSIRGFASPRADTRYNLALSQRRVVSVQNEIRAYNEGVLVPFIDNGQLRITELSFGESLAPDDVSDVLYDRRNSIYSPEASRERRVEIVEIKEGGL